MSNAALVPPPPYKNRRGWLIAFGVVEILIGCFFLLMIALVAFAVASGPQTEAGPMSPRAAMAMVATTYGIGAIIFVIIGIGSVQARRWARIATLVVSWCWLVFGILGTVMMAIVVPLILKQTTEQARTPLPPSFPTIVTAVIFGSMAIFFIALPLTFVLFYSGKNVKATFDNATGLPAPARVKPVSVIVAAVWFGFSALSCLAIFFVPAGYPLFGVVLKGWTGRIAIFVIAALCAWLAWNLYQQRALAWRVAIGWLIIGWASMLVTQLRLGLPEMYRQMGYTDPQLARITPFVGYSLYAGLAIGVAFLIFLVAIRKHFTDDQRVALQS